MAADWGLDRKPFLQVGAESMPSTELHYQWKKPRAQVKLSPLRKKIHEFLGAEPGQYHALSAIQTHVGADSGPKKRAVVSALDELVRHKLVEDLPSSGAVELLAMATSVEDLPSSGAVELLAMATPKDSGTGIALMDEILKFLRETPGKYVPFEAIVARVQPNVDDRRPSQVRNDLDTMHERGLVCSRPRRDPIEYLALQAPPTNNPN